MSTPPSWQPWARRAFFIYAAILFTLTHWPYLGVPSVVPRSDLVAHLGALGTWAVALISCGFFGPVFSFRNILWCVVAGVVYSGFDELTQAIPFIHRQCAFDDFLADSLGVALGAVAALGVRRLSRGAAPAERLPRVPGPEASPDRVAQS